MAVQKEVIQHSVTKDDHPTDAGRKGVVLHFWVPAAAGGLISLPPYPPPYWSQQRDNVLRATLHYETLWASAIYIAISKLSALSYDVKGDVPLQVRRIQQMLLQADDGMGWVQFLQKHLRDFLLCDNGAFIEVVRASNASGSRILGLVPLDSRRCTRTGDPMVPLIYLDRMGREHEMKDHQVIMMSDMPDSSEYYYGVGFCAASRAYRAIYKLSALETYVAEKLSGRRPLALHFINNVTQPQIDEAITSAEQQANQKGRQAYMGAVVISNIDPSVQPQVATIDLAGLPDGFDAQQERRYAILSYADAIGFDPQELDPELLASKALGTGAQARIMDDKGAGKGLVAYKQQLTHKLNWDVLPDRIWFYFHERDYRDQQQQAAVDGTIIDNMMKMKQAGIMDDMLATNYLVEKDVLERDVMPVDITPTIALSDEDKIAPENLSDEERAQAIIAMYEANALQQQADTQQQIDAQQAMQPPEPETTPIKNAQYEKEKKNG
jgi:hypothetical protein